MRPQGISGAKSQSHPIPEPQNYQQVSQYWRDALIQVSLNDCGGQGLLQSA